MVERQKQRWPCGDDPRPLRGEAGTAGTASCSGLPGITQLQQLRHPRTVSQPGPRLRPAPDTLAVAHGDARPHHHPSEWPRHGQGHPETSALRLRQDRPGAGGESCFRFLLLFVGSGTRTCWDRNQRLLIKASFLINSGASLLSSEHLILKPAVLVLDLTSVCPATQATSCQNGCGLVAVLSWSRQASANRCFRCVLAGFISYVSGHT